MNLLSELDNVFKFTTSADVVMEASGLRLEAIRVIARGHGVEIEDTTCRCIDESLLADLADAHVRMMKAYFNNAKRHIVELSADEFITFIDFCEAFKIRNSVGAAWSWTDIDENAIRDHFIQEVRKKTPSLLDQLLSEDFLSYVIEPIDYLEFVKSEEKEIIIKKVLHSRFFYEKTIKALNLYLDIRSVVKRVTLIARYHLFLTEDDDHQNDTINNTIIHRVPKMVA